MWTDWGLDDLCSKVPLSEAIELIQKKWPDAHSGFGGMKEVESWGNQESREPGQSLSIYLHPNSGFAVAMLLYRQEKDEDLADEVIIRITG
jgi:hypothetical protein